MWARARVFGCLVITASALAACGGGDRESGSKGGTTTSSAGGGAGEIVATPANYELLANADQRFITGLVVSGEGTVVSFGAVELEFYYLGTKGEPIDPPVTKFTTTATFMPIAGGDAGSAAADRGPRVVRPSQGLGVYRAEGVRFDAAGYWGVRATGTLVDSQGRRPQLRADTAFEVHDQPRLPAPGSPAPRTRNATTDSAGENAAALDSRASTETPLPDRRLHTTVIADAIAAGRPLVVVVSTPVYCVSRFCGPITDAVDAVAARYGDRAAFVHLEVWEDFEAKKINPSAAEWIQLPTGDANEPWVFTIGRDGRVVDRFDNVVSDAELAKAVERIAGPPPA